ncbi:hypothetical protein BU26DRAFT_601820 [Trematosphaeria pertusa]|uniref:Secreted protein n=1 Tax=Trematosphaeria pertusa TaxID=390896 RepID=A0A6A6IV40_9PLEO|nr:uncharacterized protein BU26DRAFT_601820 [Trematosphaeria pertusa]KAF2253762.1 hypothetical protein BU26DRAFT_601820 [Trematosphaeria pertusa]
MKYFTVSALLALASLGAAADFKLETWSGTDCKNGDHLTWSAPKHVGPGSCQFMANVKSLKVDSLLSHCTATVYTDANCSKNAKAARVGQCVQFGGMMKSFSVDCTA